MTTKFLKTHYFTTTKLSFKALGVQMYRDTWDSEDRREFKFIYLSQSGTVCGADHCQTERKYLDAIPIKTVIRRIV